LPRAGVPVRAAPLPGRVARRAKAFKRTTTKISDLLEVLTGFAAQATLACGLLLSIVFLAQHHPP
jgi:hypothetical protein